MNLLTMLIMAAAVATVFSLVSGLSAMTHAGAVADDKSDRWMVWRVVFQGITLLLLALALFVH